MSHDKFFLSFLTSSAVPVTPSNKLNGSKKKFPGADHALLEGEDDHEYQSSNAFGPIIRPNVRVLFDIGPYLVSVEGAHHPLQCWRCLKFLLKDKYGEKLLIGMSPVQPHTSPALNDPVLDNTVATQDFEYKMSNILNKPLYILLQFLPPRACSGISHPTTMFVVRSAAKVCSR